MTRPGLGLVIPMGISGVSDGPHPEEEEDSAQTEKRRAYYGKQEWKHEMLQKAYNR